MKIVEYLPSQWKEYAEKAHLEVFEQYLPVISKIDYSMVIIDDNDIAGGYCTISEESTTECRMVYGGCIRNYRGMPQVVRGFHMMLNRLKERYRFIYTLISAKNVSMLKLAFSAGFKITGCETRNNELYCKLTLEVR